MAGHWSFKKRNCKKNPNSGAADPPEQHIENLIKSAIVVKEPQLEQPKNTSLRKRKNGIFELRYYENGIQQSIYSKTKTELFKKYQENKPKKPKSKNSLIFENFYLTYFEQFKKNRVTPTTYKYEKRKIEMYVLPRIGKKRLSQISSLDITKLLNIIKTSRTRQDIYNLINEIMRKAKQLKFIKDNPTEIIERPIHHRKIGKALIIDEETEFFKNVQSSKYKNFLLFLRFSGARRGEALKLETSDIDFKNKLIHLKGTKTEKSDRIIPLFDNLLPLIKDCDNWIKYRPETILKDFKTICPNNTLHDLRHTFATRCLEQGITMKTVQKWLGHSTYEQTANTYTHINNEFEKQEVNKINEKNSPV